MCYDCSPKEPRNPGLLLIFNIKKRTKKSTLFIYRKIFLTPVEFVYVLENHKKDKK
jgi:hypothetical protein